MSYLLRFLKRVLRFCSKPFKLHNASFTDNGVLSVVKSHASKTAQGLLLIAPTFHLPQSLSVGGIGRG